MAYALIPTCLWGVDMEWICANSVNPRAYEKVLIQTTDADGDPVINLAIWNGIKGGYISFGGYKDKDVTHWARLPELAK